MEWWYMYFSSYPHRLKSIKVYWATYTIYWKMHTWPCMSWDQITHVILQSVLFRGQHVLGSLPTEALAPAHLFNDHRASVMDRPLFPSHPAIDGHLQFFNFSTTIGAAMITGHLLLCEHVCLFARQITRRDRLPGAQSMRTFDVNRCCRQILLSSWTVPSLLPNAPSQPWVQQLANDNYCYLLSVYWR